MRIAERSSRSGRPNPIPAFRRYPFKQHSFAISRRGAQSYADGLMRSMNETCLQGNQIPKPATGALTSMEHGHGIGGNDT